MLDIFVKLFPLATKADLIEYALVCKAWLDPVRSALYSKVEVDNLSQLQKFYHAVDSNPLLGEKVKVFIADQPSGFGLENNGEVVRLMSNLFSSKLPNLEEVDAEAANTYTPILNALRKSHLKQLKRINTRSYTMKEDEVSKYIFCIYLMRDRVESVLLEHLPDSMPDFLYDKLDQFKAVKVLFVRTCHSSWFHTLEHVTTSCKGLKQLEYLFQGHEDHVDFDTKAIAPSNVKILTVHAIHQNMLLYTMLKFPRLTDLNFYCYGYPINSKQPKELIRILNYLAPIEAFDVRTFYVDDKIADFFANYWDSTCAEVGSRTVDVCYTEDLHNIDDIGLDLFRPPEHTETAITLMYHIREYDAQHIEVIDKLDKYIGEFRFRYDADNGGFNLPVRSDLPSDFLDHLFNCCPQLNNLHLHGWMLRQRRYIPDYELSISQLYLGECSIYGDYLSRLSAVVPHLERLILEENSYFHSCRRTSRYNDEHIFGERNTLEIDMSHTEIDLVEFFMPDGDRESISYVKVLVESENTSYYYGYKDDCFITNANAMDYSTTCESQRTFISCRNKPEIRFNYR